VLAIPTKRFQRTLVPFLSRQEVDALLAAPDQQTWSGRRDHALILLAVPTVVIGWKFFPLENLIESSMGEGSHYIAHMRGKSDEEAKKYDLYAQAWPAEPGGRHAVPETAAKEGGSSHQEATPSIEAHTHGHHLVETWVFWAFVVGIGAGFAIYFNGYAIANV
jgi:hypothetical protein